MTEKQPQIRANIEKGLVDIFEELPPETRTRLRAKGLDDFLERVRRASMLTWMPITDILPLRRAIMDAVGEEAFLNIIRKNVTKSIDKPGLKQLSSTFIRLFGLAGGAIIKIYPRLWLTVSRNAGRFEATEFDGENAVLEYRDAPTHLEYFRELMLIHKGAMLGLLDYGESEGAVEVDLDHDPPRLCVQWTNAKAVAAPTH